MLLLDLKVGAGSLQADAERSAGPLGIISTSAADSMAARAITEEVQLHGTSKTAPLSHKKTVELAKVMTTPCNTAAGRIAAEIS